MRLKLRLRTKTPVLPLRQNRRFPLYFLAVAVGPVAR
jgi:hypothetical protein